MATGHSVIPIDANQLADEAVIKYLADEMIFLPENLPHGRFPTLSELREAIRKLNCSLEESLDWYVTAKDDFTEIWFKDASRNEDKSIEFWFRRGNWIFLDIMQLLADQCGSFLIASHSGEASILIVPDVVFGTLSDHSGYYGSMSSRLPAIIEQLKQSSVQETLFLLSQVRQLLRELFAYLQYDAHQSELIQKIEQGLPVYRRLLEHTDPNVRALATEIVAALKKNTDD